MRTRAILALLAVACLFIAACDTARTPVPATDTPTTRPSTDTPPSPTDTAEPAEAAPTDTPAPVLAPTLLAGENSAAGLEAAVLGSLPPGTVEGVRAISLSGGARPAWLVHSIGFLNFQLSPLPKHFVAVYVREENGWRELAREDLDSLPDYVAEGGVKQALVEPSRIWIEVKGGAGAHSGTYELLSLDNAILRTQATGFSSSPGAGELLDLNADAVPDVILDDTDYYVFCYACGMQRIGFSVLRWNASQQTMEQVTLQPLAAGAAAGTLVAANNRAVDLARAGLWKEALNPITLARAEVGQNTQTPEGSLVIWNQSLIKLHVDARAQHASGGPYPLLGYVFYGDYAAAVNTMRAYTPEQIFRADTPLIAGTVAETWPSSVTFYITSSVDLALTAQPDLAAAIFLRGWAETLADPSSGRGQSDVARAAQLAPSDRLFVDSAAYLSSLSGGPQDGGALQRIAFAPGATSATAQGQVEADFTDDFVLRALQGQMMMVDITSAQQGLALTISGASDGQVLVRNVLGQSSWRGRLPATQDYVIQVFSQTAADFTLGVIIPQDIQFAPGAISAAVDGVVAAGQVQHYTLRALAGQTMTVNIVSPNGDVLLTLYGLDDGQPLVRSVSGATGWSGALPATQDYAIQAVSVGDSTGFVIQVTVQ